MSKKSEQMYTLVKSWQSGTQSKSDFCKGNQINIQTFTYWVQKYKSNVEDSNKKFVPLQIQAANSLGPLVLELCYPNGLCLRIEGQPEVGYLSSLIRITI